MAADSTLVNAAFNLSKSRAGANTPSMAPLMQAQVGVSAGFLKMAEGAMGEHLKKKEIQRVGKAKQLKGFENIFNNTLTSLYEQKEPLPQPFVDKLTSEIELLQEDFEAVNSYGKGDTSELARERARIMGELKRKSNEIINFRAGLEQFAIDRQNGLINEGLVKQRNISPAMMALDLKNFQKNYDAGNAEVGYDENGNMGITVRNYGVKDENGVETFDGEDVFVTIESLNKTFPKINLKQDAGILERQNESAQTGKVDGLKPNAVSNYNREERYSEYFDGLDTDEAISNIVARKIKGVGGMNPSFKDALLSDINIPLSILDTMFYDDDGGRVEVGMLFQDKLNLDKTVDENGNQVIDEKDRTLAEQMGGTAFEAFELNIDKMIDVITNVGNEAFDGKRTAGLLADYLTNMDEEKYNTNFDIAKKSKDGGKSGNYTVNKREMSAETFERSYGTMVRMINSPQEGDVGQANGINFMYKNGKYFTESTRGKFDVEKTQFEVATDSGLLNYTNAKAPDLDNIDLESVEAETEIEVPNSADFAATASPKKILASWKKRYEGKGFEYDTSLGGTVVTITADNGETHVAKLSTFRGNRNDQARALNEFIEKNKI
jgi:hypothetical protein